MFYSSRTGPDKYLPWKLGAFVIGVALILLGDRLGLRWMIWIAIGILAIAFLLRFLPESTRGPNSPDPDT